MADVFISYKRGERAIVERLRDLLTDLKVDVWFDARLEPGESFNQEITREARAARAILVCWSPEAAKSDWVQAEAMIGLEEGKLVAANVVEMPLSSLPIPFNTKHTINLVPWVRGESNSGWREIVDRIAALLHRPGLRDFIRLPDIKSAKPSQRLSALEAWAKINGADPLAEQVWREIEELETEDQKRRLAERKAMAAAEAAARAPREKTVNEVEAERDAAQGRAWRALGDRPTLQQLKAFASQWKAGPLVELARREIKDREGGGRKSSGLSGLAGAVIALGIAGVASAGVWMSGVLRPPVDPADEAAWSLAKSMAVEDAYKAYLTSYPSGSFVGDANRELENIVQERKKVADAQSASAAWTQAQSIATAAAYEQYLKDWPQSTNASAARNELQRLNKMADDRAWTKAQGAKTLSAYSDYLRDQPNGLYRASAELAIEELNQRDEEAWRRADGLATANSYNTYLRSFPSGKFAAEARSKRDTRERADVDAALQASQSSISAFQSKVAQSDAACTLDFMNFFEWDRSDLTSANRDTVNAGVTRLSANCVLTGVLVVGHDDSSQAFTTSFRVSQRRAETVRQALMAAGVAERLIVTAALGETVPYQARPDGVREPLNRRAEIKLIGTRR